MPLLKMKIPPDQSGYVVQDGNEVLSVKLDGGASRFRKDVKGATSVVNTQWTVDKEGFQYLRAFYREVGENAQPFLIDLYLNEPELVEHEAYFAAGTMKFPTQRGHKFVVSCQLEVKPTPSDSVYNLSVINGYVA